MAQTLTEFLKALYASDDKTRLKVAQDLKKSGFYEGTPSGKVEDFLILQTAAISAEKEIAALKPYAGDIDRLTYYKTRKDTGTGSGRKATVQRDRQITGETRAAALLDTIAEDLLGRKFTESERAKYTKLLQAEQKKSKSDTVTTYSGGDNGTYTTTSGLNEEQFLKEKIGKTAEAKTNRATDAYQVMLEELGGLR